MNSSNSNQHSLSLRDFAVVFALITAALGVLWFPFDDGDVWWHIAVGDEILSNAAIPSVDEWTFTAPGVPYIYHSWLGDILLSIIWNYLGGVGLEAIKYAAYLAACVYVFYLTRRILKIPFAIVAVLLLAYWVHDHPIRPHIFTPLFTLILMDWIYFRPAFTKSRFFSTLFLVLSWTNLHGGFAIGLALIAVVASIEGIGFLLHQNPADRTRWYALLLPASLLTTLVNPYGFRLYEAILTGVHNPSFDLNPIQLFPTLNVSVQTAMVVFFVILYSAGLLVVYAQTRRFDDLRELAVVLACYGLALYARRLQFLLIFPLCLFFQHLSREEIWTRLERRLSPWARTAGCLALIAAVSLGFVYTKTSFKLTKIQSFPEPFADYLSSSSLQGNLFCPLTWSGRVTLATHGRLKIYIDGRLQLHPPGFFNEYIYSIMQDGLEKKKIEQYPIDFLLVPFNSYDIFIQASAPILWKPLQVFDHGILLQRQTSVNSDKKAAQNPQ